MWCLHARRHNKQVFVVKEHLRLSCWNQQKQNELIFFYTSEELCLFVMQNREKDVIGINLLLWLIFRCKCYICQTVIISQHQAEQSHKLPYLRGNNSYKFIMLFLQSLLLSTEKRNLTVFKVYLNPQVSQTNFNEHKKVNSKHMTQTICCKHPYWAYFPWFFLMELFCFLAVIKKPLKGQFFIILADT